MKHDGIPTFLVVSLKLVFCYAVQASYKLANMTDSHIAHPVLFFLFSTDLTPSSVIFIARLFFLFHRLSWRSYCGLLLSSFTILSSSLLLVVFFILTYSMVLLLSCISSNHLSTFLSVHFLVVLFQHSPAP